MRYQSKRPRRQFLAGVSCPNCHKMDSVVQVRLFGESPDEYIECVQCQYQERRPTADDIAKNTALATDAMVTGTQGNIRFID